MQLVVDANVVMSTLARDSAVRTALRITPDEVATPWYIVVETDKHRGEIRTKSGLSSDAFDDLLDTLWGLNLDLGWWKEVAKDSSLIK